MSRAALFYAVVFLATSCAVGLEQGVEHQRAGRFDQAIDVYLKVIAREPINAEAYARLGAAYNSTRQYRQAIDALTTSIQLNPRPLGPHWDLAYAFSSTGYFRRRLSSAPAAGFEQSASGYRLATH
jgi:Flp pilus assembly protein TadD